MESVHNLIHHIDKRTSQIEIRNWKHRPVHVISHYRKQWTQNIQSGG